MNSNYQALLTHERLRQDIKWGEQNHPDDTGTPFDDFNEAHYKRLNKEAVAEGRITWRLILLEEMHEALAAKDPENLKTELVQVGAVCQAWFEAIDRRTKT